MRKTIDVYAIEGWYYGKWGEETREYSLKDAKEQLKCYRDNLPNIPFRIRKSRERITDYDSKK